MRPSILLIAAIGMAGTMAASPAQPREVVQLRDFVVIEGDAVRLGDLFDPAGAGAAAVVGRAPAPGRREIYDAERLRAIARNHGIAWSPVGRQERSVVERASRLIDRRDIEDVLIDALSMQGLPKDHKIEIANRGLRIFAPLHAPAPLSVQGLFLDQRSGHFTATLSVANGDGSSSRVPIAGRSFAIAEVPVLRRRMAPGEIIRADDVAWAKLAATTVPGETISDAGAFAGKTPRRPLREGVPVLAGDLRMPVQVPKGSSVMMTIESATMQITVRGLAAEDGAIGETIRVVNPQSNRTIEGVVTGPGRVRITSPALALR